MRPIEVGARLRVDWLTQEAHGLPGRLGLTHAPGIWRMGASRDEAQRIRADLDCLAQEHGTSLLVTLLDHGDLERFFAPGYLEALAASRMACLWLPIPDGEPPPELHRALEAVDRILADLAAGRTVVIHCLAGLGRAGTLAACCLVARGQEAGRAVDLVRGARAGAIQTAAQVLYVRAFAQALAAAAAHLPVPR